MKRTELKRTTGLSPRGKGGACPPKPSGAERNGIGRPRREKPTTPDMPAAATCFLAEHGITDDGRDVGACDGPLVRCHLIPRQLLRREVWPNANTIAAQWEQYGWGPFPVALRDLFWLPGMWVPGCGGICGSDGHHGMLDRARSLRIPFNALPPETVDVAARLGLSWWLEREYPGVQA